MYISEQSNSVPNHLWRVEIDRVGVLDPVPQRATLRQDHRRAGHRGVDVGPSAVLAGDIDERAHRVDRRGSGRADADEHRRGLATGCDVRGHRTSEGVGVHSVAIVDIDQAHRIATDARQQDRLRYGAVRHPAAVHGQGWAVAQAAAVEGIAAGALASAQRGHQRGGGRRIVNRAVPVRRQPQQVTHPVAGQGLELRERRGRLPVEADDSETAARHIAEERRQAPIGRKEAEVAGVLKVRGARHDHAIEIVEQRVQVARVLRWFAIQFAPNPTGLDPRPHRALGDVPPVIGDPVDQTVGGVAKFLRGHD